MNTPLNLRLAAASASIAIAFSLFCSVVSLAEPPVAGSLLAQSAPVIVR